MASGIYDIITVGGGLGGATLAKVMAERGARVLVLEQEQRFRDRVRGENIWPWGVAEFKELGIYELLRRTCAWDILWFNISLGAMLAAPRDVVGTSLQQLPGLNFYHPDMQTILLQAAVEAGAEVRRGTRACDVKPGAVPVVTVEHEGREEELRARLVVCADGRASLARKWGDFTVRRDVKGMTLTGVLLDEMPAPQMDTNYLLLNPQLGQTVFLGPLGQRRVRAYLIYPRERSYRFQGEKDLPRFIAEASKAAVPAEWYAGVKAAGPLATFDGTDTWVEHPYRDGVVLVGDAAAASDPSYGQGLSLTVRDVRVLRDSLLGHTDWDTAGHAYAEAHDDYYGALHKGTSWFRNVFYETGPEADARRARAFPLFAQDPGRIPDILVSGPEVPLDETVRRRFFGEE
jgi:2-polyprenyl-6-methoxyphenol hydroxylase-like FAD-dependent oxidoreductase